MATRATDEIAWDTALPLFSRRMLGQWTGAIGATALVMALLMVVVFGAGGEWDVLPPMLAMIGGLCAGIWVVGWLIMLVVFRGKYRVRFTLTGEGIRCDTIDKAATSANRLALIVGLLARRPQAVGAGLIGVSRESEQANWSGAFRAVFDPGRSCIMLRNAWRTLMWVQCTPENYQAVAAAVGAHMDAHQTASRVARHSPVPAYLGRTALVVAATLPLFAAADEFDTGVFLPILILCFAAAMVWMVNLFGWVVLGGLALQAGLLVASQFEVRESVFDRGETYRAYEVLGPDDISLLLAAAAGAAVLIWMSVRALRGRWLAALIEGAHDAEGD